MRKKEQKKEGRKEEKSMTIIVTDRPSKIVDRKSYTCYPELYQITAQCSQVHMPQIAFKRKGKENLWNATKGQEKKSLSDNSKREHHEQFSHPQPRNYYVIRPVSKRNIMNGKIYNQDSITIRDIQDLQILLRPFRVPNGKQLVPNLKN